MRAGNGGDAKPAAVSSGIDHLDRGNVAGMGDALPLVGVYDRGDSILRGAGSIPPVWEEEGSGHGGVHITGGGWRKQGLVGRWSLAPGTGFGIQIRRSSLRKRSSHDDAPRLFHPQAGAGVPNELLSHADNVLFRMGFTGLRVLPCLPGSAHVPREHGRREAQPPLRGPRTYILRPHSHDVQHRRIHRLHAPKLLGRAVHVVRDLHIHRDERARGTEYGPAVEDDSQILREGDLQHGIPGDGGGDGGAQRRRRVDNGGVERRRG
mmetsp:Transcript_17671/g.42546  ORF Transcript_17671/g.42546 Transcript_17671/m.42546 type:complete len:264 (+) Transcript_17671:1507-2298(+)